MANAHYAIALLHEPDRYAEHRENISPYWHQQRLSGVQLVGVQIEWADAYLRQESSKTEYENRLRTAARLGNRDALLDLAEHFDDPAAFNTQLDFSDKDPIHVAELAETLGRPEEAKRYLTIAAESGDTEAMRRLIEGYDSDDLQTCWKWLHLAKLFGVDHTEDRYRAVNEDGSDYDDDVGGPAYPVGRDGIDLPALSPDKDKCVQQAAREIYALSGGDLED